MKKIKCAVLGFGNRGEAYGNFCLEKDSPLNVMAVIDPDKVKLEIAKKEYSLNDDQLFISLDQFLAKKINCDLVINATMDEIHKETLIKLIMNKYDVLMEKPIVGNKKDLLEILNLSKKYKTKIFVCHVLRYTPFYSRIKQLIDKGDIGKIISLELNEHVWYGHFVNAYVRGKWNNKKECGSSLLLAKCCHDTDLICWLNNASHPLKVSSFGSKSLFSLKNAPQNSAEYCYQCNQKDSCMFNAMKFELEKDFIPSYTWVGFDKPINEITTEEKIEYLKHSKMGQCVYKTNMDIVDRQCVNIEFENGSIATLNMIGGTSKAGRHIDIVGTLGEIVGYLEDNYFILRKFDIDKLDYKEEKIDLNNLLKNDENTDTRGHSGGDYYIMKTICNYLLDNKQSVSLSNIEDSIYSHLICFAADESMRKNKIISVKKI